MIDKFVRSLADHMLKEKERIVNDALNSRFPKGFSDLDLIMGDAKIEKFQNGDEVFMIDGSPLVTFKPMSTFNKDNTISAGQDYLVR